MTEFSRAAKRPHWPREKAMQFLFECAGIENPRASSWKWNDIFFDFTSHAKLNVHPVQVCFMIDEYLQS